MTTESGLELQSLLFRRNQIKDMGGSTSPSFSCVLGSLYFLCLHPQYANATCTRLMWEDEVNGRLGRDGSVGVWSQFSGLTGSVLRDPGGQ